MHFFLSKKRSREEDQKNGMIKKSTEQCTLLSDELLPSCVELSQINRHDTNQIWLTRERVGLSKLTKREKLTFTVLYVLSYMYRTL